MIPLIPIFAIIAVLGGGVTLVWYDTLSEDEKEKANCLTAGYARTLFDKSVEQLSSYEARMIHDRVKAHFN